MNSKSTYMDCKEVSGYFGVNERIIREMAEAKLLPRMKFGKVWRFPRVRILDLLDRLPKSQLEKYEIANTLIVWMHVRDKAPVGFCSTLDEKIRNLTDDKTVYEYYSWHKITALGENL
jgi:hypothetical protein